MAERTVNLSVDVETDADLPRVMEVLARHAAGLILEGVEARIYCWNPEDQEDA